MWIVDCGLTFRGCFSGETDTQSQSLKFGTPPPHLGENFRDYVSGFNTASSHFTSA
jgi:hypothetical protein